MSTVTVKINPFFSTEQISNDLWRNVFNFLNVFELIRLQKVNKHFQKIVVQESNVIWKFHANHLKKLHGDNLNFSESSTWREIAIAYAKQEKLLRAPLACKTTHQANPKIKASSIFSSIKNFAEHVWNNYSELLIQKIYSSNNSFVIVYRNGIIEMYDKNKKIQSQKKLKLSVTSSKINDFYAVVFNEQKSICKILNIKQINSQPIVFERKIFLDLFDERIIFANENASLLSVFDLTTQKTVKEFRVDFEAKSLITWHTQNQLWITDEGKSCKAKPQFQFFNKKKMECISVKLMPPATRKKFTYVYEINKKYYLANSRSLKNHSYIELYEKNGSCQKTILTSSKKFEKFTATTSHVVFFEHTKKGSLVHLFHTKTQVTTILTTLETAYMTPCKIYADWISVTCFGNYACIGFTGPFVDKYILKTKGYLEVWDLENRSKINSFTHDGLGFTDFQFFDSSLIAVENMFFFMYGWVGSNLWTFSLKHK